MNVIVPLNKRVIVEPEARETKSKGGIVIPDTANQKAPTKGRVIAIDENGEIKLKIIPGDVVLFPGKRFQTETQREYMNYMKIILLIFPHGLAGMVIPIMEMR